MPKQYEVSIDWTFQTFAVVDPDGKVIARRPFSYQTTRAMTKFDLLGQKDNKECHKELMMLVTLANVGLATLNEEEEDDQSNDSV